MNPNPIPRPTANPIPEPTIQLPSADLNKVRITAENQARMIANRVVEKYGSAENARYNLWLGLNDGVRSYMVVTQLSGDQRYRAGQLTGQREGSREASVRGEAEGSSLGASVAQSDALIRFRAVVDTASQPDVTLRIPQPNATTASANIAEPKSIDDRIREQSDELIRRLSSFDYLNRGNLSEMYGWKDYRFDLVKGYYREDWAWNAWNNRELGGGYESELTYLQKISDANQTLNAESAKQAFRSQFKSTYDLVIDQKWESAVSRRNSAYYEPGVMLGQRIGADYAQEKGYADGYRASYPTAFIEGKYRSFPAAYTSAFQQNVQKL
jgi:hypothetical protein